METGFLLTPIIHSGHCLLAVLTLFCTTSETTAGTWSATSTHIKSAPLWRTTGKYSALLMCVLARSQKSACFIRCLPLRLSCKNQMSSRPLFYSTRRLVLMVEFHRITEKLDRPWLKRQGIVKHGSKRMTNWRSVCFVPLHSSDCFLAWQNLWRKRRCAVLQMDMSFAVRLSMKHR